MINTECFIKYNYIMKIVRILFFILILYLVYNLIYLTPLIIGGFNYSVTPENTPKYITEEEIKPLHILIVDVPNMTTGWFMTKYKSKKFVINQKQLFKNYIECITDHYDLFFKINDTNCRVNYVFKNHQFNNKGFTSSTEISNEDWDMFKYFIKTHQYAYISIAEDYNKQKENEWSEKKYHYLRERDDFLSFRMAQMYKRHMIDYCIMSDDKFKDFVKFGNVPQFYSHYLYYYNNEVISTTELLKPVPNSLGCLQDYNTTPISLEYVFDKTKFE